MTVPSQKSMTPNTSVQYVKGIGPKRAEVLARSGIVTVEDLLAHYPRRYLDRSNITDIRSVRKGESVTVMGKILSAEVRRGRKNRFVVLIGDGTGILQCVWFQGIQYVSKAFEPGETVAFSGKVTVYRGPQLVHPEYDKIIDEGDSNLLHTGGIIPMYPSTEVLSRIGLDSRGFRRILREVLNRMVGTVPETQYTLPIGLGTFQTGAIPVEI